MISLSNEAHGVICPRKPKSASMIALTLSEAWVVLWFRTVLSLAPPTTAAKGSMRILNAPSWCITAPGASSRSSSVCGPGWMSTGPSSLARSLMS